MADPRMSMMSMVSTSSVKPNTRLLNSWNIPYDDVKFIKALGQGFFGTVHPSNPKFTNIRLFILPIYLLVPFPSHVPTLYSPPFPNNNIRRKW